MEGKGHLRKWNKVMDGWMHGWKTGWMDGGTHLVYISLTHSTVQQIPQQPFIY